MKNTPIGVFDSGVGGLSVLHEIRKALPQEDLLYVADSGFAPYGEGSNEFIQQRAEAITGFFVHQGVKTMVVACNTATAVAVRSLRSHYALPIVAMEPALKPAAEITQSGIIAILATHRTLASESFSRLAQKHGKGIQVLLQPCPGWVEQVEKAELSSPATQALITRYVAPLVEQGADTLVLGCTHYPFLSPLIKSIAGPSIAVVDPSAAVARELRRRLMSSELVAIKNQLGTEQFWSSGSPQQVQAVITQLWGKTVKVTPLPAATSMPTA
ncbi:MAG: glutamate racemase [Gammaproteobacteria bacterium]|nr:glutamate racemase [Gammaproteobacteria bacterium]